MMGQRKIFYDPMMKVVRALFITWCVREESRSF